jgi:hypothetical protein
MTEQTPEEEQLNGEEVPEEEQVPQEELQALENVDQDHVEDNPYTADDFTGEQEDPDALRETVEAVRDE